MELKQYWNLFWKWKWLVVLGVVLAAGTAFLVSRSTTPEYRATTSLLVTPGAPKASESYSSLVASERLAQTYAQLLGSKPLLEETFARLEVPQAGDPALAGQDSGVSLPPPLDALNPGLRWATDWWNWAAARVGLPQAGGSAAGEQASEMTFAAEPVRDTQLITVRVEGTDPDLIAQAANTLVEVFIEWQKGVQQARYVESKANLVAGLERVQADIEETEAAIEVLEAGDSSADRNELTRLQEELAQYRNSYTALLNSYSNIDLAEASSAATISVVSPAVTPTVPFRPRVMRTTLLAAVVGGMLAVGIAFLIEYLDDTVKSQDDLQSTGLPLIAAVQQVRQKGKNGGDGLFTMNQPRSLVSESYRTLRTNLQFSSLDKPLRNLVVTSAVAGEGKTTTASNLAVVMAQDGKRVVLVDADLRRPQAHRLFNLHNRRGLTTALVDDPAALGGYLQSTPVENLQVLAAGPVPHNPQELLGSQRMADLLQKLQEEADIVLLDTPPSLAVADANVLAARADGVLMVVNTGETRRGALQQAAEGLRQVGANLVGGVLNMVPTRKGGGYHYQYYYYHGGDYGPEAGGRRMGRLRLRRKRSKPGEGQAKPAPSES